MRGWTWSSGLSVRAAVRALAPLGLLCGLAACGGKGTEPTPVCTFTIAPPSQELPGAGGEASVMVTASAASCTWTAGTAASWVTVVSGASGTGSGSVTYRVSENPAADPRTATLTVAGLVHTITQQGRAPVACTYAISPTSAAFDSRGGTGSFSVTAPAGCAWTAKSSAAFVTITSGASGEGSGTVSYRVAENGTPDSRTATVTVADQTFTITQQREPAACDYRVAPVEFNPCMAAGTGTVEITTGPGCTWTASSNAAWLTITSGQSGSGSGRITFSYTSNYLAPRTGLVMVRWPSPTQGQNVRVNQAGCRYGVSQPTTVFPAAGGNGSFQLVQQSDPTECGGPTQDRCVWTAVSRVPWITITTSMPRAGDDTVRFTIAPNTTGSPRTGTITVADQTVQITQGG